MGISIQCLCSHSDALSSRHNAKLETDLSPGESIMTLCSSSSLALMLGQIPTPQKEAYFAVILGNTKCAQSLNKVSELVIRSLNLGTSPGHANVFPASPMLSNPFHCHKPDKFGGRHRLIGQNANTFSLRLAANAAGFCQRDKLMNPYLTTGNPDQRLKTLQLFLTEKSIIHDNQAILGEVLSIDR